MKFLLSLQNKQRALFEKGGPLHFFYPLFEANDTFLFSTGETTHGPSHVRDASDLKRVMITVVVALLPSALFGMFNTGYQVELAMQGGAAMLDTWQTTVFLKMGYDPASMGFTGCFLLGALYLIPVYIVTLAAGGMAEVVFALVRRHEISEGFLVTSALFPLTLPPTVPLWQVALAIIFGCVVAKEVFGGVGMNIWNPALVSRAFLYFGYPGQISGDSVWVAAKTAADTYSGATWVSIAKEHGMNGLTQGVEGLSNGVLTWWQAFIGLEAGSMGETSALLCLVGAVILIVTRVASWRIMLGCVAGATITVICFNIIGGSPDSPMGVPFWWHWVIGGFAFAVVFMATDPVSAPFTPKGQLIYGVGIGFMGILIREVNPAYAGSWMLAILFMNTFASLIDHFIVQANIKRRMARHAA